MRNILSYTASFIAFALLAVSCSTNNTDDGDGNAAYLTIAGHNLEIIEEPEGEATRAELPYGNSSASIGLAVIKHPDDAGSFEEYLPSYHYIYASYHSGYRCFTFRYYNKTTGYFVNEMNHIPVYTDRGKVKLYGMSPTNGGTVEGWNMYDVARSAEGIRKYPFHFKRYYNDTHETMYTNYMVMDPIVVDPSVAEERVMELHFTPVFTRLYFALKREYATAPMAVHYIQVETLDGGDWLVYGGYIDGTTGELIARDEFEMCSKYLIKPSYTLPGAYPANENILSGLVFPPIEVSPDSPEERKLKVTFFVGADSSDPANNNESVLSGNFIIDLKQLQNDKGEYGLRKGYSYDYYISFDNYLKFNITDFSVSEWGTEDVNMVI